MFAYHLHIIDAVNSRAFVFNALGQNTHSCLDLSSLLLHKPSMSSFAQSRAYLTQKLAEDNLAKTEPEIEWKASRYENDNMKGMVKWLFFLVYFEYTGCPKKNSVKEKLVTPPH